MDEISSIASLKYVLFETDISAGSVPFRPWVILRLKKSSNSKIEKIRNPTDTLPLS